MLWALTAAVTVVGRTGLETCDFAAGPALFFALAMVGAAVMFLAVGALTSQLAATRRQAAAYGAAMLGVAYAVRMVADAGVGLDWLRWASPLGWVEELRPLDSAPPLALIPIGPSPPLLAAVAVAPGRRAATSARASSPTGPPATPPAAAVGHDRPGRAAWSGPRSSAGGRDRAGRLLRSGRQIGRHDVFASSVRR